MVTFVQAPPLPPVYVQPSEVHAASVVLLEQEDADCVRHVPLPVAVQPGSEAHVLDEQLEVGVPAQCGPVVKIAVAAGKRVSADLQQI